MGLLGASRGRMRRARGFSLGVKTRSGRKTPWDSSRSLKKDTWQVPKKPHTPKTPPSHRARMCVYIYST